MPTDATGTECLSPEDAAAGYILVELAPALLDMEPDPLRDVGKHWRRVNTGEKRTGIYWERDDAQPHGEVTVSLGKVVKVFPTMKVKMALIDGRLVKSDQAETAINNLADHIDELRVLPVTEEEQVSAMTAQMLRDEITRIEAKIQLATHQE